MQLKRGMFVYADFGKGRGHEQSGKRPAIILSNNAFNQHNNTVLVAPITSTTKRVRRSRNKSYATTVLIPKNYHFHGCILLQHLRSISIQCIDVKRKFGMADECLMKKILHEFKQSVW